MFPLLPANDLITSLWQIEDLLTEQPKLASLHEAPRHELPTSGSFFDCPTAEQASVLCQARLFERYKENWRTPKALVSAALSPDNPKVLDNGTERALHDGLFSATFGFHPAFGCGHVLRTNGVICMFWNRETVAIVEVKNLLMLRIEVTGAKAQAQSPKKKALAEAMSQD